MPEHLPFEQNRSPEEKLLPLASWSMFSPKRSCNSFGTCSQVSCGVGAAKILQLLGIDHVICV